MKKILFIIAVYLLVSAANSSYASFNPREFYDFEVIIPKGEKLETDMLAVAGNLVIEGEVTGEVVLTGANIKVAGDIRESLSAYGGNVVVSGNIDNDVIVKAGNAEIGGKINKDFVCYAGNAILTGTFGGKVKVFGGRIRLNGKFAKGVEIYAYEAVIGPETEIQGDLFYASEKKIAIGDGAKISGKIKDKSKETKEDMIQRLRIIQQIFASFMFLSLLVTGILLNAILPNQIQKIDNIMSESLPQAVFAGIIGIIVTPIIATVVFATIVGIPAALILMAGYFAALYLSFIFAGIFIGKEIIRLAAKRDNASRSVCLFVGLLSAFFVGMIPYLGTLVMMMLALSGFGGLVLSLFKKDSSETMYPEAASSSTGESSDNGKT